MGNIIMQSQPNPSSVTFNVFRQMTISPKVSVIEREDLDFVPDSEISSGSGEEGPSKLVSEKTEVKKTTAKRKRFRTGAEKHDRDKDKHKILPPCKPTCKRQCIEKIGQDRRETIHAQFWEMNYNERRAWIYDHVKRIATRRPRSTTRGCYNREFSRLYVLPNADGKDVFVCKIFFIRTLGYHSDNVITATLSATTMESVSQINVGNILHLINCGRIQ